MFSLCHTQAREVQLTSNNKVTVFSIHKCSCGVQALSTFLFSVCLSAKKISYESSKLFKRSVCVGRESKTSEVQLRKSFIKTKTATNKTIAILYEGKRQADPDVYTDPPSETHFTAQHSPHSRCNTALMPSPFPSLTTQPTVPAVTLLLGRTEQLTCSLPKSCLHTWHPHHPCTACSLLRANQKSLLPQLSPFRKPAGEPFLTALHTKELEGRRGLKKLESKNSSDKSGEQYKSASSLFSLFCPQGLRSSAQNPPPLQPLYPPFSPNFPSFHALPHMINSS